MRARWIALAAALALAGCGGGKEAASNTGGNDTGAAQNALGGVGEGPALNGTGGVQNPGNASGDNPQGETSPSGPGESNGAR